MLRVARSDDKTSGAHMNGSGHRPSLSLSIDGRDLESQLESPIAYQPLGTSDPIQKSLKEVKSVNAHPESYQDLINDQFDPEGLLASEILMSPALQHAMIESPREQELLKSLAKLSVLRERDMNDEGDEYNPVNEAKGLHVVPKIGDQEEHEDGFSSPGGSKSVKFGQTDVVDDFETHSDYFSMSPGSRRSSPAVSRQSSISHSCLVAHRARQRAASVSVNNSDVDVMAQVQEDAPGASSVKESVSTSEWRLE